MKRAIAIVAISCLTALTSTICYAAASKAKQPPNIVFFFADDLGYADLACNGHPYAKTPVLDKLASEGARFTQHYATGTTCCPSRCGVMTGRHPARYEKYPADYGYSGRSTITELLKTRGYSTGHFGKWHMGPDSTPGTYGIDEIIVKGKSQNAPGRDDDLVSDAIRFIEKHADGPFYVNIWGHSTHYPVQDYPELAKELGDIPFKRDDFTENIQGKFDESKAIDPDLKESMRQYLADVYSIDKNMGRVLKTLDRLGIAENTIVVFSSDQGPAPVRLKSKGGREFSEHMLGYAGNLRGGKHEQLEGGVRVPFIIRWPGHIEAGRVDNKSVTSFMDWLPTLCAIAGVDQLPEGLDGEDVSDIWLEGPRERSTTLFWRASNANGKISLREGHWKFHENEAAPLLYDLFSDEGEKNNVADQFSEVVKQLSAAADEWRSTLPKEYDKAKKQSKNPQKGGIRVPATIVWPERITKPIETHMVCSTLDIMPSISTMNRRTDVRTVCAVPSLLMMWACLLGLPPASCGEELAESRFPSVDELPTVDKLPDPFQFFGSDRRVTTKEDWQQRRAEMLRVVQYYSAGPAFPQTLNAKVKNVESKEVYNGKATHFSVDLVVGPEHAIKCAFEYVMPNTDAPKSLLFYICPKREYAEETIPWRERIIDRGYAFAWFIVGQFNGYKDDGPVKDAFPEVKGNTMMAWVWGINEVIHYLDKTHDINKVIVTGTSRYGKTAAMAGVMNERIDLTVPVTGGFGVRRFNIKDQKQPASAFAGRCWSNDIFPTFAGQLNKMPMDQHFVGALIAPRGLLAIMGDENNDKNVGHIEAYEALVPVYEWLGAKNRLGLYDHSPRGHGIGEDDFFTILDFADQIFYGKKPESGKAFDQISNPGLVGFEWKAPAPISE